MAAAINVGAKLTRKSSMMFHVADVARPLESARHVAEAGNKIVMSTKGSYIENESVGEKLRLRPERGTDVVYAKLEDGSARSVTLDSGVGVRDINERKSLK